MKNWIMFFLLSLGLVVLASCGDEKAARLSAPAVASDTLLSGNVITINYSRPSLKGRVIGKDIAKFDTLWRTGDNEATIFEMTKDAKIQGKPLVKGKYSLYTIPGEKVWTIILNKTWDQWGMEYNKEEDVLRVQAESATAPDYIERMKFVVERDGRVLLFWGDTVIGFTIE